MSSYHTLPSHGGADVGEDEYSLTNKRKVVVFVEEWCRVIGEAFWEDPTIKAFLEVSCSLVLTHHMKANKKRSTLACYIPFGRKLNDLSNDMQHAVVCWPHNILPVLSNSETFLEVSCSPVVVHHNYESKLKKTNPSMLHIIWKEIE